MKIRTRHLSLLLTSSALLTCGAAYADPITYYMVATNITGANTKIDTIATSTWDFTVAQSFVLGGASLVMKDGPSTSDSIFLTLYDITAAGNTPSSPGSNTGCLAGANTNSQVCMTNSQFHSQVDFGGGGNANNDQSYLAQYYFFGATSYSSNPQTVTPDTGFTLLAGHEYQMMLTSQESSNNAYFIKGDPNASTWNFSSLASCANDFAGNNPSATCTNSLLGANFLNAPVGGPPAGGSGTSTAPEPSTALLLLPGLALVVRRRMRRV